ncbi:MAG: copper chaperone PCu(A)C [Ramlibacter sp.]|jgi:copper(I)-binding protein|nr:copper chaperone PCu(A)C [Ramlibacter sp.]
MNIFSRTFFAVGALTFAVSALAGMPLKVEGAWVHSTVPGQQGAAAFMTLTAQQPLRLVGVSSPVAGTADLHQMKREGEVMTMRPLSQLELPAGRAVELSASGYHLMLQDLKQPLRPGTMVPLTLVLRDAKGVESKVELKLPVAARAPAGAASMPAMGGMNATDGHKH